jgi:hypothetical protein
MQGSAQCFSGPQDGLPGMARVYVFRPAINDERLDDRPVLLVDNTTEILLTSSSYAPLDLAPGWHHLKLSASNADSAFWDMDADLDVGDAGRYYLAIWNSKSIDVAPAEAVSRPNASRVAEGLLLGPVLSLALRPEARYSRNVRYEVVKESDALPAIRQCTLSPPRSPTQAR